MKFSEFKKNIDNLDKSQTGFGETSEKIKNLEVILDIVKKINSTLILEDVLRLVLHNAIRLTSSDRGFIVLRNSADELEYKLGLDAQGNQLPESMFNISTTVIKDVFNVGHSKFIEGAQSDTEYDSSKSILHLELQTILCSPLITGNKKIGVIYVDSKHLHKVKAREITDTFEILAGQAATAIRNAQLYNGQLNAYNALNEANIQLIQAERKTLKSSIDSEIGQSLQGLVHIALLETESLLRIIEKTQNEFAANNDPAAILLDRLKLKSIVAIDSIRNIQKFAQVLLETSLMNLNKDNGDLNITIQSVVKYLAAMNKYNKVVFKTELNAIPLCNYDSEQIQHLLVNLFNNAVEARKDVSITIKSSYKDNFVNVEIEDNGPGFPPEIENPFYKVIAVGKTSYGLYLCKSIIDKHNGYIKILQRMPGAIIQFSLPVI
jgi:signal transduction histidine kinase